MRGMVKFRNENQFLASFAKNFVSFAVNVFMCG